MNFSDKINELENSEYDDNYIIKYGTIPVLFTAVHTMMQQKDDGSIKLSESYTKAISLFLNEKCKSYAMIKIKDDGYDSNKDNNDKFKQEMIKLINDNDIKLVIDLHGSSIDRDFDIEFGTLNFLTCDFSTIKVLEEAFNENGINNIKHNEPFKGGAITQYLYGLKDVDAIQLEINKKYRQTNSINELETICDSLIDFVNKYMNTIK